jgi:hypothetical protein
MLMDFSVFIPAFGHARWLLLEVQFGKVRIVELVIYPWD